MPDDSSTDTSTDDDNPAIHGSESAPDDTGPESADDGAGTTPHLADQGKDVVDSRGEDLGVVSDVDGDVLYVEPDPTLAEEVLNRLHWRSGDRDEVQVPAERILRIDDAVVLDVEREAEFRSEP